MKTIENRKWEDLSDIISDVCSLKLYPGYVLRLEGKIFAFFRGVSFPLVSQLKGWLFKGARKQ